MRPLRAKKGAGHVRCITKPDGSAEAGQEVDGNTAYIVWKAETADNRFELGTDTFIVQNGKIVTQTFAGKISPKQ